MGYLFLTVALTLNATANLLMKMGADRIGPFEGVASLRDIVANRYLLGGVVLFALNIVFYLAALARMNLSVAYPVMMAGGVLIVATASVVYFREPLSFAQVCGIVLVIAGIVLVSYKVSA
jgi:multidrug transporter EmrE-like cation transporter